MPTPKNTILVVDDEEHIRQGLLDVLVFNDYAASGAEDGELGLAAALELGPDVVVLDVMMPGLDGIEVCRRLRAARPEQPILMLTAKGAEDDVVAGFKAGADDYVCKPFSLPELLVRVEALLRRSGRAAAHRAVEVGGALFDPGTLTARRGAATLDLTRREMDMVLHLAGCAGRIVSRREFLAEVWCYPDPDVETRTVDIHMQKLRKKLEALWPGGPGLIETVRGEGYRLRPQGPGAGGGKAP